MIPIPILAIGSVLIVSMLSLLGILFYLVEEKIIRKILLYVVSFSTGALLGDVFLHIIPDLANETGLTMSSMVTILFGIVFSFGIEKVVHWRHCHLLPEDDHGHHHSVGIMSSLGEGVHNFIDGIVIGVSYLGGVRLGLATTLAVIFHEIPHEVGNFAVLMHSGYGRRKALKINVISACTAILGTVLVLLFSNPLSLGGDMLLPFAAGNLIYIAGSDLIPELHKETGVRQGVFQLLAMIAGMAFMYLMLFME